jgi:glycerol-3-phosphate acyltransferase PlsX
LSHDEDWLSSICEFQSLREENAGMSPPLIIALDAMGGDHGPPVVVAGAARALARHPGLHYRLYGDEELINRQLERFEDLARNSTVIHTSVTIAMDAKPSQALRAGRRDSSMWKAIEAVKLGEAHAIVSAGNTGALMAMSKICLKMLPNVERPAIAGIWPTIKQPCIVLDLGGNIGASATKLVDFALMGAAMSRAIFHIETPSVGLLNIGVEEVKGVEEIKAAHAELRVSDLPVDYKGFIEGSSIGKGDVDVVVTEGFSGNIALKTAEGTAEQMGVYLREAMNSTLLSRLGALMARGGFRALKERMDTRQYNGGSFLGLKGIVIKSHGATDEIGFASAIDFACEYAHAGLVARIAADVEHFHETLNT